MNTHSIILSTGKYLTRAGAALDIANNFTYEGWFRFLSLPGINNAMTLMSKWTSDQKAWLWFLFNNNGTLEIRFRGFNGSAEGTRATSISLSTNTWTHLAVTFSSGNVTFYVNGSSIGGGSLSNGVAHIATAPSSPFAIGMYDGGLAPINAYVDEVRVWTTVRSSSDIQNNYLREDPLGGSLKGYWKLNNSYNDSSGNNYTLTPNGSPSFDYLTPFKYLTLSDSLPLVDSITADQIYLHVLSEVITPVDSVQRLLVIFRTEALTIVDSTVTNYPFGKGAIQFYKSSQSDSDGGTISSSVIPNNVINNLFPNVTQPEAEAGSITYRKFFVKNTHPNTTWNDVKVWLDDLDDYTADTFDIALGTANDTDGSALTYTQPKTKGDGLSIGSLAPDASAAIWIRRTVQAGKNIYQKDNDVIVYVGGV